MNIVMIGPFAFKPKATVHARAFLMARALVGLGHSVTILMPPYDNRADSGIATVLDGVDLKNMVIGPQDTWNQIAIPPRMARRAVGLKADVVHVFKPVAYSGSVGIYLRWFSRLPMVLDTDDWEGTGGWNDINPYPWHWKRLFDWQERWLVRHADVVTVASRTLQTQAWGFGANPERVLYLPNGPDRDMRKMLDVSDEEKAAARAHLGVGDAPFALYLGTIPHGSDLDLALDAFARIRNQIPEAKLVIAGQGDGIPALQAQAEQIGVADRVVFPGWIEQEEVPIYIAAADATVNPYRDTLINRSKCAIKGVAAMAMGKAVVTSRVGENLEYIIHGQCGLLTEAGNPADLAAALLEVLSDRMRARELGRNARRRIWDKYDWDVRAGILEDAYRVAGESKRGTRRRP